MIHKISRAAQMASKKDGHFSFWEYAENWTSMAGIQIVDISWPIEAFGGII